MEAARSSLRSVASEAMGIGKNGVRGTPITIKRLLHRLLRAANNKFLDIMWQNPVLDWSDLEQNPEQDL